MSSRLTIPVSIDLWVYDPATSGAYPSHSANTPVALVHPETNRGMQASAFAEEHIGMSLLFRKLLRPKMMKFFYKGNYYTPTYAYNALESAHPQYQFAVFLWLNEKTPHYIANFSIITHKWHMAEMYGRSVETQTPILSFGLQRMLAPRAPLHYVPEHRGRLKPWRADRPPVIPNVWDGILKGHREGR